MAKRQTKTARNPNAGDPPAATEQTKDSDFSTNPSAPGPTTGTPEGSEATATEQADAGADASASAANASGADPAPADAPVDGDRPAASAGAADGAASTAPAETSAAIEPGLRIAAKRDGFRRAGMAHTKAPVVHPAEVIVRLGKAQVRALLEEPMLSVVELITPDGETISRERLLAELLKEEG